MFASLSLAMKILWGLTALATLIFIIQSIMTFVGADTDSDLSGDIDGVDVGDLDGGSNLLTFRNFVNFMMGFGWSAILLKDSISSPVVLIIVSVLIGVGLVAVVMYLFKWLGTMQQSGNIYADQVARGCEGTVYLTIPAARSGQGKVQIAIGGAVREYDAVTESETAIANGKSIRVVDVIGTNLLLVEETNNYTV